MENMQTLGTATLQGRSNGGLAYKWIVAIVVMFGAFMSILDQTIVNTALPRLQNAFGADLHGIQWVLTAYILTQGVVTPTTAFFVERIGAKRFYMFALAAFTLGSALCGLAWSLPTIIVFRVVQGIGGAFLFPLASTLLFSEFPITQRGLASGLLGIAALLAPAIGPTLGGYFVTYVDWPFIFFVNVPVGIVGLILAALLLREQRPENSARFDLPGFALAATGLASLLYAISEASTDGWGSTVVLGYLILGLLLLAIFVVVELAIARRGGQPLVKLRLFTNSPFLISNIASVLMVFAFFGGLFILPLYMQSLRGLTAFQSGLLLLPFSLASIVAALIGGRLYDRFGARIVVVPGMALLGLSTWEFTSLSLSTPYWWLEVIYIIRGLGLGLVIQPLGAAALAEMQPRQIAQATALSTVLRFVSTSLGIAVLATLIQTRTKVHYTHLAEQVTPSSPFGQFIQRLQAVFLTRGADLPHAHTAAVQLAVRLVQRQAAMLAIQDAFWLTVIFIAAALIVALFIRSSRKLPPPASSNGVASTTVKEEIREEAVPLVPISE